MADLVRTENARVEKPGQLLPRETTLKLSGNLGSRWASRGGDKLVAAIDSFSISVTDKIGIDVGASTGGFTDVLLQRGAAKVFAVDVGTSQLDHRLRQDPRVVVLEGINARFLQPEMLGPSFDRKHGVDIVVMDLSFISTAKVIPALIPLTHMDTDWIVLIKPQFEAGEVPGGLKRINKGGIVKDDAHRDEIVAETSLRIQTLGLKRIGLIKSPIKGAKGNQEFLAYFQCTPRLKDTNIKPHSSSA